MYDGGLTIEPNWTYVYDRKELTDTSYYDPAAIDINIDNKLKINWDTFGGLDIKIGDEVIHISKEEFADALFKLFPNLPPKFAAAMFGKLIKEAKC